MFPGFFIYLLFSAISYCQLNADPFKKTKIIPETFHQLPFSSIIPKGWIKTQIENDLAGDESKFGIEKKIIFIFPQLCLIRLIKKTSSFI